MIPYDEATLRRVVYLLAIGLIFLWTGYCVADLVYVALNYWSLVPGLGLLTVFTDPEVVPGFWSSYLMRLTTSWGSIVTGAGVVALLLRPAVSVAEPAVELVRKTFPVIPESERTEPRLLFIEEPRPPRYPTAADRESATPPSRRTETETEPLMTRRALRQPPLSPQPRQEQQSESDRSSPARTASIFRAIRTRSPAAPRQAEEDEEQPETRERKAFSGPSRDEFGFFKVEYQDGTTTIERVLRSDYDGDDAVGIGLVRRRLAERAAAEGWPTKPIAAITPVSHLRSPTVR